MKKQTYHFVTPEGTVRGLYAHMMKQAHLLVAGASGSGKSVLVNGLLTAGLYDLPVDVEGGKQFILIDPKRVELAPYRNLPHCLGYASEPQEMVAMLQYAVRITEARYKVMVNQGLLKYRGSDIYVIIEELADLMTTNRRAVQPLIQRLCQIARAARVHVVAVTQCPLVKVIPTEIKVNFDGVVALRTRSAQDCRNIIGVTGAEHFPQYGECLYYSPEFMNTYQYSVPMVTDEEKYGLINFWLMQYRRPEEKKGLFTRIFRRTK